jgi:carbon monoxide dehydrogenase subunit G
MITFQTSVRVERPIEEVFAFVSDPFQFPRWNSAVQTVERTSGETGRVGSMYSMQREISSGRVVNGLEVVSREQSTEFGIRTTSGPTPFSYRYRFIPEGANTLVQLDASVELPAVMAVLGPVAARAVRRGVDANFAALKRALEARATDARSPIDDARSQA